MAIFPPISIRNQPLKGLFLSCGFATVLAKLPIWFFTALLPSSRPRKSWTIRRTMHIKLIRALNSWLSHTIGPPTLHYRQLVLGDGVSGEWIQPLPESLIQGEISILASVANLKPIRVPGYWYTKDQSIDPLSPAEPNETVVLFLHGGGYVAFSAHPTDILSNIAKGLMQHTKLSKALSIEYRLSATHPFHEDGPFPAALIDALSGYCHLISRGFAPENIIVAGDSAGGNLSLALTRYLVEQKDKIQDLPAPPGRLLLFSPWVDLWDLEGNNPESSLMAFSDTDYLHPGGDPGYAQLAFTGPHGLGMVHRNRYISPAGLDPTIAESISFKGFPPTFISVGGAEIFHDQIMRLKERIVKDLGEEAVTLHLAADAVHDYVAFPWFEPERSQTLEAVNIWLK